MRAIWSGYLTFGLVNIPVKVFSATSSSGLDLDMLHEKDYAPIRYAKFCTEEDKEVPYDEIVKGFEFEKGQYVILDDEDFKRANIKKSKSIAILDFADESEVNSIYYDKPYFMGPDGADQTYALFRDALDRTGKVGIGKFVLRNREHLVEVKPEGNILFLNQMRYASEVRNYDDLALPEKNISSEREMEMAVSLIGQLSRPFNIKEYHDTYHEELLRVIEEKKEGKIPKAKGSTPAATRVPDLVKVLQESLKATKK